jgi:hypothetical protein
VNVIDDRLRSMYPVDQLTTSELAEYRDDLETALALDTLPPLYAPRDVLQGRLDAVLAEQADRERIRRENRVTP